MRRRPLCAVLLLTAFLLPLASNPILAESNTVLYVEPRESRASVGEMFTIDVRVRDVQNLVAYDFWLKWNTTLLEFVGASEGPFLNSSGTYRTIFAVRYPGYPGYPYTDEIYIIASIIAPTLSSSASGTGTLARVTFKVLVEGNGTLDLHDSILAKYDPYVSTPIAHTSEDGYFAIQDTSPPVTTMSLSGVSGDNDWYTSDVEVTLSATDDKGVRKTEYSFDNASWITYTAPFKITNERNTNIFYRSYDETITPEATKVKTVRIDKTLPEGVIRINNDFAYAISTAVVLNVEATDAASEVASMRFSNDGVWDTESWENPQHTRSWSLTTGDGAKTVYYQIKDNAGLTRTYSDSIILDTAQPTITITSPSAGYETKSSTVVVEWAGSDEGSGISQYDIKLDGGDWTNVEKHTAHSFTGLGEGSHTLFVRATDLAGNVNEDMVPFIVNSSPFGGPGYIDEAIISLVVITVVLAIIIYFVKLRKH